MTNGHIVELRDPDGQYATVRILEVVVAPAHLAPTQAVRADPARMRPPPARTAKTKKARSLTPSMSMWMRKSQIRVIAHYCGKAVMWHNSSLSLGRNGSRW